MISILLNILSCFTPQNVVYLGELPYELEKNMYPEAVG